jgi:hypothetical protein
VWRAFYIFGGTFELGGKTLRCPVMLQIIRSKTRTATVSTVDQEFDSKTVINTYWSELTGFVAQAQYHIIAKKKDVARNVLSVKVTRSLCEDLTLIGLPGIGQFTEAGKNQPV